MNSSSSSVITEAGESAHGVLPPGFRFVPTQEEKVSYYLKKKIQGQDSEFKDLIPVIDDVCKIEPWDIPAFLGEPDVSDHEKEWIFFTRPVYKYNNSTRCSRTTDRGYYKMQGKEHNVKARKSKDVVGKKKNFTFYRGRAPNAEKDDWFLDEYSLTGAEKPNFVLCCLKKGPATSKKLKEDSMCDRLSDSSSGEAGGGHIAYNYDQAAAATDMNVDSVEHLVPKEQGDVLNVNGNHEACHDSPNSSCLSNDVVTIDDEIDGSMFSDPDFQAPLDKKFGEISAQINGDLDRERLLPSDRPQQPQPQDYCSSNLSSPHTELAHVPGVYYGDGSKVQSSFGENNSHLTVTDSFSTGYQNVPISNVVHNFQKGASDEGIPEAYFQPTDNLGYYFPEFQLLEMSPMNLEQGDLCMSI